MLSVALPLVGCGGGDGGDAKLDQAGVRECLAAAGMRIERPAARANPALGSVSPDFRASLGGDAVDIVVEPSEKRARRSAADLHGALSTFGVPDPGARLQARGNVVAVFERDPGTAAREAVAGCLD
jgi:hypothetical protein